jgi:hypothetical protein
MSALTELISAQARKIDGDPDDGQEPFSPDAEPDEPEDIIDDENEPLTEPDTAPINNNDTAAKKAEDDEKRRAHEEAEAKRKAEWDAKQQAKKDADAKALAELAVMSDDAVMGASVKRVGGDLERLTRRNMKMCVTEHIQTLCLDGPEFARLTMNPRKSMINCFKYINRRAQEYLEQDMKDNDEKPQGNGFGGDVPDDFCYKWAEDYYRDPDAKEDADKDEKFVPKTYYGGSSATSKPKKKEAAKPTPEPKKAEPEDEQLAFPLGA